MLDAEQIDAFRVWDAEQAAPAPVAKGGLTDRDLPKTRATASPRKERKKDALGS